MKSAALLRQRRADLRLCRKRAKIVGHLPANMRMLCAKLGKRTELALFRGEVLG